MCSAGCANEQFTRGHLHFEFSISAFASFTVKKRPTRRYGSQNAAKKPCSMMSYGPIGNDIPERAPATASAAAAFWFGTCLLPVFHAPRQMPPTGLPSRCNTSASSLLTTHLSTCLTRHRCPRFLPTPLQSALFHLRCTSERAANWIDRRPAATSTFFPAARRTASDTRCEPSP